MPDLEALLDLLERRTAEYAELSDEAVKAEYEYRSRKSQAYVSYLADKSTKRTVKQIDALVDHHVANRRYEYKLYEARRQSCRESMSSLRTQIEAVRTIMVNTRAIGG